MPEDVKKDSTTAATPPPSSPTATEPKADASAPTATATPPADPPKEPVVAAKEPGTPEPTVSSPDSKSKEPAPPEPKYELKLPEKSLLSQEHLDTLVSFAKEHKVSPEVAQKLLERESSAVDRFRQGSLEAYQKQAEGWKQQILKDPELGGSEENLKKTLHLVGRLMDGYGTPALKKELETMSLGNHPELTRAFYRIAKAFGDDSFVRAPKDNGGAQRKSDAELFWPKKKEA